MDVTATCRASESAAGAAVNVAEIITGVAVYHTEAAGQPTLAFAIKETSPFDVLELATMQPTALSRLPSHGPRPRRRAAAAVFMNNRRTAEVAVN